MPFSQYSTLEKSLKVFHLNWSSEPFVVPPAVEVSIYLRDEIDYVQKFIGLPRSESARRESLIFPILREACKHYPQMQLWSHEALECDADLTGTPDYFLSRRSPQGSMIVEQPYFACHGNQGG